VKPRHGYRLTAKQRANADRCGMPVTEYLDLPRPERKRRLKAAREQGGDHG
jgi:hypothetical protein